MIINRHRSVPFVLGCSIALSLAISASCARKSEEARQEVKLKKMPAGAQNAGFLSSYEHLQPSPTFENTLTYVKQDDTRNVHKYFAMIVDPVEIYVATNADVSKIPDRGRTALAAYFQHAIERSVSDAFPIVQEPGPLVLRLRTALIGVDTASQGQAAAGGDALDHPLDIGKVGVEMEMVDSVSGEQIVAAIDRQNLGSGAVVGSVSFSRDEKFQGAKDAFDGWAARLRDFLDSAHEFSAESMKRADESYRPYGDAPRAR